MQNPKFVAADTNVLILLADNDDVTVEAWQTIKVRIPEIQFLATPTVLRELRHKEKMDADPDLRQLAEKSLHELRTGRRCKPRRLSGVQETIAALAAKRLRDAGLLPEQERNDAFVLAEAAVLQCNLLLPHDSHLRKVDFSRLLLLLRGLDLSAPVIATPNEVVTKFYR